MRETTPGVELIARPSIDLEALERFLKTQAGETWLARRKDAGELNPGQLLIEAAGRACYRSWEPGLNKNVTRVRTDQAEYFLNLMRSGHGSVMEHANYSFILSDVSRVFCYDEETEVLTSDGWIPWPKVTGEETFGTLNPETGHLEYQEATEYFCREYSGPMYEIRSEQVDLLVTPNHRMWVQKVDTQAARRKEEPFKIHLAKDVLHKRVRYQKVGTWERPTPEAVTIPATTRSWIRSDRQQHTERTYPEVSFPSRPFASFLGWYLAEGYINRHSIVITQNRGEKMAEIVSVIKEMGLHPYVVPEPHAGAVKTSCTPLRDLLAELGGAVEKRIPHFVHEWSAELIRLFLEAMIAGDGTTHHANGHQVIYTASKELADDLQVLAIKAGISANVRIDDRVGMKRTMKSGQVFYNLRPTYVVSLVKRRLRPHVNNNRRSARRRWFNEEGYQDRVIPYEGRVYCVKVPNGLLFVRRNGKPVVSGNTHELVRHRAGSAFSQESLRFVRLQELPFRIPESMEPLRPQMLSILETLEQFQIEAAEHFGLDEPGKPFHEKKEITSALRRLAPEGVSTVIFWTANVRTLRHVIQMRTDPSAEEELRIVFDRIGKIMQEEAPLLFADFVRTEDGAWVTEHRKV